jgi:apolipoprotein N-acyltransferase
MLNKKWHWNIRTNFILLGCFSLPLLLSSIQFQTYQETKNPIEIVAIQPNIDPYNEKFSTELQVQLQKIMALGQSKMTKTTDLVLAPETAISEPFYENDFGRSTLHNFLKQHVGNWHETSL